MADTLRAVAVAALVYRQASSPLLAAMTITINFLPRAAGVCSSSRWRTGPRRGP